MDITKGHGTLILMMCNCTKQQGGKKHNLADGFTHIYRARLVQVMNSLLKFMQVSP